MPFRFECFIVFALITVGFAVWRHIDRRNALIRKTKAQAEAGASGIAPRTVPLEVRYTGWVLIGLTAITGLLFIFAVTTQVGTKEEGIKTTFGKTTGHLPNGLHLIYPWEKVHEMDAAIQTDSYTGKDCLSVRIANQQTGCASVSIQWRIQPNSADELYKDYRSFDHVRDALVTRKLTAAVNEAFAHFNPLDSIVNGLGKGAPSNGTSQQTLGHIAGTITTILRREVGARVEVLSTILPLITFDEATQGRINQLQQQVALTRIATQQKITNQQVALANQALAKSVNKSPNVLVSRCLDALEQMVKNSQPVPAGFSCWPGSGVAAVIAGPK